MVSTHFKKGNIINIFCALALFTAVSYLPIKYYTFLRIIVFIGCLFVLLNKEINFYWKLPFIPIALLFNPIFPIYLYIKSYWIPLDIIAGILFLLVSFYGYTNNHKEENKKKSKQIVKNRNMYNIKQ